MLLKYINNTFCFSIQQVMKKLIPVIVILLITQKALTQNNDTTNNFIIKGKLVGTYSGELYLAYIDAKNNYVLDSTILKDGNFKFTGYTSKKLVAWFKAKTKFRLKEDLVVDSLRTILLPNQTITALLYSEDVK